MFHDGSISGTCYLDLITFTKHVFPRKYGSSSIGSDIPVQREAPVNSYNHDVIDEIKQLKHIHRYVSGTCYLDLITFTKRVFPREYGGSSIGIDIPVQREASVNFYNHDVINEIKQLKHIHRYVSVTHTFGHHQQTEVGETHEANNNSNITCSRPLTGIWKFRIGSICSSSLLKVALKEIIDKQYTNWKCLRIYFHKTYQNKKWRYYKCFTFNYAF